MIMIQRTKASLFIISYVGSKTYDTVLINQTRTYMWKDLKYKEYSSQHMFYSILCCTIMHCSNYYIKQEKDI
ncbi:hypothetical protein GLYMA_16G196100v4 [Glycine max]|uniref:Uncharacterized protein n=1 Tax=Glycine max TaxID=3847 RepID=K7MIJ9_SOYBN|nr:hypothetical protein GLYMA_16G196100v4 [Glycine max]